MNEPLGFVHTVMAMVMENTKASVDPVHLFLSLSSETEFELKK